MIDISSLECPECGATAFEVPEPNGDTSCVFCHHKVNVAGDVESPRAGMLTDDGGWEP